MGVLFCMENFYLLLSFTLWKVVHSEFMQLGRLPVSQNPGFIHSACYRLIQGHLPSTMDNTYSSSGTDHISRVCCLDFYYPSPRPLSLFFWELVATVFHSVFPLLIIVRGPPNPMSTQISELRKYRVHHTVHTAVPCKLW